MAASVGRLGDVLTTGIRITVTSDDEKRNREKRDPRSKKEKRGDRREREREREREKRGDQRKDETR